MDPRRCRRCEGIGLAVATLLTAGAAAAGWLLGAAAPPEPTQGRRVPVSAAMLKAPERVHSAPLPFAG
ncbi:hypothetical protein, partial [Halorhodospira neutriphila]